MPVPDQYPWIFVNSDGTARELHASEREYLETRFPPADGGRPYIKFRYSRRDGWGDLAGFMERSRLPDGMHVLDAPTEDPQRPPSPEELEEIKRKTIAALRGKGFEIIENSDGSWTEKPRKK
jgi:hypothetical protein